MTQRTRLIKSVSLSCPMVTKRRMSFFPSPFNCDSGSAAAAAAAAESAEAEAATAPFFLLSPKSKKQKKC